jgi:hypothetical protein
VGACARRPSPCVVQHPSNPGEKRASIGSASPCLSTRAAASPHTTSTPPDPTPPLRCRLTAAQVGRRVYVRLARARPRRPIDSGGVVIDDWTGRPSMCTHHHPTPPPALLRGALPTCGAQCARRSPHARGATRGDVYDTSGDGVSTVKGTALGGQRTRTVVGRADAMLMSFEPSWRSLAPFWRMRSGGARCPSRGALCTFNRLLDTCLGPSLFTWCSTLELQARASGCRSCMMTPQNMSVEWDFR